VELTLYRHCFDNTCSPVSVCETFTDLNDPARGELVLVVEPDYLPDLEVFYFQPCLCPMKYLHPRSMYTLPHRGVHRGGTPSVGSGGGYPPRLGGLGESRPPARVWG
jgi:hypothetical protein